MFKLIHSQSKGFSLPGWEEERLNKFSSLVETYEGVTEEILFDNLTYFLQKIIPVCEEVDVKMAIHPDDPPFEIFGFPRITKNSEDLKKILSIIDSPYNGITMCTGSLGANPENDLVKIIHEVGDKINFVHFRNVKFLGERHFKESAHLSIEGSLDMYSIMKALLDVGFDGVVRQIMVVLCGAKLQCLVMVSMIAQWVLVICKVYMKLFLSQKKSKGSLY